MRLHFWLKNLYRQLSISKWHHRVPRRRIRIIPDAAIVECLEPRQLLTAGAIAVGTETRVNTFTTGNQFESAIATDASGDYVVTWQSSRQDGSNYGVYAQRYNSAGVAKGGEFRVNSTTTGFQGEPAIAMDSAGDFVIAWFSSTQDAGTGGVYAQRYNSNGTALGSEFQVNTYTTDNQIAPTVAMDAAGDFVIAWISGNQDGSGWGVYAQRYGSTGTTMGTEFRVNTHTNDNQDFPSAAMDATGNFVITWTSINQDGDEGGIYAQRFSAAGVAQGSEFRVNSYTTGIQNIPDIAMDSAGAFVVTWQSEGEDGSDYGVYAQRYNSSGSAQGTQIQVNSYTTGNQGGAQVSMDATGDFIETWRSVDANGTGVYAQQYNSSGVQQGNEFRVSTSTTNPKVSPVVAMNAAGGFVVSWQSGFQDGSGYGIYSQRYAPTGGPLISEVLNGAGDRIVNPGDRLSTEVAALSVEFTDDMNVVAGGANSVTNLSNWMLTCNGIDFSHLIQSITFSYYAERNDYQAKITFSQPLPSGAYQLIALSSIHDVQGRSLDGDDNGVAGGNYHLDFSVAQTVVSGPETRVNSYTTDDQRFDAIASDAAGDYVVAWSSHLQDGSGYGVYAQRYNAQGSKQGSEFRVNTFTTGDQDFPSVAMDAAGDFVITWQSIGQDGSSSGIYAQRFSSSGVAQGGEFRVNTHTTNTQESPSVTMDAHGDFVIAWASYQQDGDSFGVYAQRYNAGGVAQGTEFQVNTYTTSLQFLPSVAMDAGGDFIVTWTSGGQDGDSDGVYARHFNAAGTAVGPEFRVNTFTTNSQDSSKVAMDALGDFVITWESFGIDGDSFGIFAQVYGPSGIGEGEFQVNTYTTDSQGQPAIATDATGDFVVTWSSKDEDGSGYGVYARRFDAAGVAQENEARVNVFTTGPQNEPGVAMDAHGDFVVQWQGISEDGSGYGVFTQRYRTDIAPLLSQIEPTALTSVALVATPVTSTLLASDQDNNLLTGATVRITSNYLSNQDQLAFTNTSHITGTWNASTGILTLTGSATPADYAAALHSVTYKNMSPNPNTTLIRTLAFQVTDGLLPGNVVSRNLTVFASAAPTVTGTGPLETFVKSATPIYVAPNLVVTQPNGLKMTSATVSFTNWQAGDNVSFANSYALQSSFTQDLTNHTAVLTITGSDTAAHYQTLLRSVTFWNTAGSPVTWLQRVATFAVTDSASKIGTATQPLRIAAVASSDPPVITGAGFNDKYFANEPAIPLVASLSIVHPDNLNLYSATVSFANWQNGDQIQWVNSFALQHTFTQDLVAHTAMLSLTGSATAAQYQTTLQSITFLAGAGVPVTTTRAATITVTDVDANSASTMKDIDVFAKSALPEIPGLGPVVTYVTGTTPVAFAANAYVNHPDNLNITSLTVSFTNWQNGDQVQFSNTFALQHTFTQNLTNHTAVLSISGSANIAAYSTTLESMTFSNVAGAPVTWLQRVATIKVTDILSNTVSATQHIKVNPVANALPPAVTGVNGTVTYVKSTPPVVVAPNLIVTSPGNLNIYSATVSFANWQAGDQLQWLNTFALAHTFTENLTNHTAILTLTGIQSVANYQATLRSIKFQAVAGILVQTTRVATFTVTDVYSDQGSGTQNVAVTN